MSPLLFTSCSSICSADGTLPSDNPRNKKIIINIKDPSLPNLVHFLVSFLELLALSLELSHTRPIHYCKKSLMVFGQK